jgi:hypothetical protein
MRALLCRAIERTGEFVGLFDRELTKNSRD